MPEYYNFSILSDSTGYMDSMKNISQLSGYMLGYFFLIMVFLIPLIVMVKKGKGINGAMHVCSLYTFITAILLYLAQVIIISFPIFIFGMIYVITLGVKWYNRD